MRTAVKAVSVAVAAAGTVVLVGGAASASPAPSHETINLRAHSLSFNYTGPNQAQPTPGYNYSFTEALYPTNSKTRIGTDYVNCDVVTKQRNLCTASWVLKNRGQIEVQGSFPFAQKPGQVFTLAVVGGTGEFRGMRGVVHITDEPDNTYYTPQTFVLTR